MYAPKLYRDYHDTLGQLFAEIPGLKRVFPSTVLPAASFNFGPNALSRNHTDHGNRAAGWCTIFAAGDFDSARGGHIVLEEFGLVIEFPSGSTILIPSATCTHGNTPIQSGETRTSFTQYAAGGLFRFVEYGFRSWKTLVKADPDRAAELDAGRDTRWEKELQLFSLVEELHADRASAGLISGAVSK